MCPLRGPARLPRDEQGDLTAWRFDASARERCDRRGRSWRTRFGDYPEVVHLLRPSHPGIGDPPRYLTADCIDALRSGSFFGADHEGELVGVSVCLPPDAYPASTNLPDPVHVPPV